MAQLKKLLSNVWAVEVNTGTEGSPTWTRVNGLNKAELTVDGNSVDVTDFDSAGWEDSLTTTRKWTINLEAFRGYTGPDNAKVMDPGQEHLRARGLMVGSAAYTGLRFYRTDLPGANGYSGTATVNFKSLGGDVKGVEPVSVELAGSGALTPITV
jgi:hypothetical protein